jgi:hypothetical protein
MASTGAALGAIVETMAAAAVSADAMLIGAALSGHTALVEALLADGRADPTATHSLALRDAAYSGHLPCVLALLADGRADPAARDSAALYTAAAAGHTDVVRALVMDGRTDPAATFWPWTHRPSHATSAPLPRCWLFKARCGGCGAGLGCVRVRVQQHRKENF